MAAGVVAALAVVDVPLAVTAGTGLGLLGIGVAWARLRERRDGRPVVLGGLSPWDEQDEAILAGDLSLSAWEQAGQARRMPDERA
jgi:hypothetical protein